MVTERRETPAGAPPAADGPAGVAGEPRDADPALSSEVRAALVALLYALADDELIIGHRDTEWTGLGPILEEDIAFSSIAQDELGHALTFYRILESLGEGDPDTLAFGRPAEAFRNAVLLELPRGDYAFSLVRQFLYDVAEAVRLEALATSTFPPLAEAAVKMRPEERYHLMHGASYVQRLGRAGGEARERVQAALAAAWPGALALWEPIDGEARLEAAGIAPTAATLRARWLAQVATLLDGTGLHVPESDDATPASDQHRGGRHGRHTPHHVQLLEAMQGVYRSDPAATW